MKPPTDRQDGLHSGGKHISKVRQWVRWGRKDALKGPPPFQSAIILLMCGRYRLSGGNSLSRNISTVFPTNQTGLPGTTLPPPSRPSHPPEPQGAHSEIVADAMGTDTLMAKDSSIAAQMINARSETAAAKPAFRDPLASRRCSSRRTDFTSGGGAAKRNSRTVLKSMPGSCSRSREYGIAGRTRRDSGSSPVRF